MYNKIRFLVAVFHILNLSFTNATRKLLSVANLFFNISIIFVPLNVAHY